MKKEDNNLEEVMPPSDEDEEGEEYGVNLLVMNERDEDLLSASSDAHGSLNTSNGEEINEHISFEDCMSDAGSLTIDIDSSDSDDTVDVLEDLIEFSITNYDGDVDDPDDWSLGWEWLERDSGP